jgi:hypothetical protein
MILGVLEIFNAGYSFFCLNLVCCLTSFSPSFIPGFGCSYNDLDAPDEEVTVLDYRSL